jgi:predicted enzyme involved in methoxymalonyl-ACP biosynthesis
MDGEIPHIDAFVMSCRIMGKRVEQFLLDYVERDMLACGYTALSAEYIPSARNSVVRTLYENLGYQTVQETATGIKYEIQLATRPERVYFVMHDTSVERS